MIPRSGVAAVAAVLALMLAGCSDSDGSPAEGSPGPGTSESASPTASPSPAETPSATETTPEVAPATGPTLLVEGLRVRAPRGWHANIRLPIGQGAYPLDRLVGTLIQVYRFPNSGLFTIDELANVEVEDYGPKGKRRMNVVVDGRAMYHITGTGEDGEPVERFGTIVDDQRVAVTFYFGNRESTAEREEIIESVLASARLG